MSAPEKLQTAPDAMRQRSGAAVPVWDPSWAQRGCLHPTPARGSCALGAASPRVCKGQDPLLQKERCGLAALPASWLPQGETFLRAHTLYGAKTNICSGGGPVAQPGRFATSPSFIEAVSAGDVAPGTQHSPFGPEAPGQPWPNRGAALPGAGHPGAPGSEPGWGWTLPRSYLGQEPPWVGIWVWPLPFSPPKASAAPPGCAPRALPASRSAGPGAHRALSALCCVPGLSQAVTGFEGESCCFGERLLSEQRALQSAMGACYRRPQVRAPGTTRAPAAGAERV